MIALEGGNYDGLFLLIILIMFGPPILLSIIGFSVRKTNKQASLVLFILAGLYLIIGLGICGGMFV
ncbi:hypothetical protein OX283_006020 [Flavobacterium sp. SUN052]|jgi:hypothetical protein|uniref:hypothetical protein n=1 Tax=Flavobacterium sp. SUN052 TaxID=3002441 RepID=UPI00237E7687|nr:hypothetical protein [Flavobacterium sp. SUN052]MEC4004203.1 hypothetical protein [Flavobacterium sp. SUN052]